VTFEDPTPTEIRAALLAAMARHPYGRDLAMIVLVTCRELHRLLNDPGGSIAVVEYARRMLAVIDTVWNGETENDRCGATLQLGKLVGGIRQVTNPAKGGANKERLAPSEKRKREFLTAFNAAELRHPDKPDSELIEIANKRVGRPYAENSRYPYEIIAAARK
jgi:hypothetical protein